MTASRTPADLLAALDEQPEAKRKWFGPGETERLAYVQWVDDARALRRRRIAGTVARVLHDRPQRSVWGRLREGAGLVGDEVAGGNYPPYTGAGTAS